MTRRASSADGTRESWSEAKRRLSGLPKAHIPGLLRDLWDLASENRQFIAARLGSDSALAPFLAKVESCLSPDPFRNAPLRLREAQRAISAYRKATGDVNGTLQLQLRYVECGTAFAADFGALDDTLVDSLIRMFQQVVSETTRLSEREPILHRLQAVVDRAEGMGWGYYDTIGDILEAARAPPKKRSRSGA